MSINKNNNRKGMVQSEGVKEVTPKNNGGLLLASQSIRDFVPDHADYNETVSKIKRMVKNCTN